MASSSSSSRAKSPKGRRLLLLLGIFLFLHGRSSIVSCLPQRGQDLVLELPPPADSATSETAVVRQVSVRRPNAIPQASLAATALPVKIANLTRQHDGDEFQALGEL